MLIQLPSSLWGRLLAAAAVLLATATQAAPEAQLQGAFAQFSKAQGGDGAAIERAAQTFEALLRTDPANPVLIAYAGATTAMRATTTILPWKKIGYAEDGMALLDKALNLLTPEHNGVVQNNTPDVLEVRFMAANTFLAVPGFMHRSARGAKLLGEVLSSPLLAQSPLGFRGAVWLRAARLAESEKRADDARRYLKQVIDSHAPQADAARARLRALAS